MIFLVSLLLVRQQVEVRDFTCASPYRGAEFNPKTFPYLASRQDFRPGKGENSHKRKGRDARRLA